MDILTEIYRIKQVMGLITEQNDKSLVDENVYEAIKNIESKFSFTDKNGNIKGETYTGKEKESNIKKAIQDTIGLDYWFRIKPKLRGQIYSFMYQADSSENSLYRWLAGLAQSIDPNIERKNVFADKVAILDSNGNDTGKKRILPLSELSLEKQKNIESAIKKVQDAIVNNKINYLNYMNIVKNQYENLGGTTNDAQNRIKIWAPRPEALDRLMNNESWPNVKAWWYKKIGETDPTNQVNNASTQKDSTPANPNVAQPPVIQKQDSALANTVQSNIAAPSITTSQATQATLTQDSPPIDSELDRLETSGITDTGVVAPFTDKPYISSGNTIYNQRKQSSTLQSNPKLRRPWGDPYIYYSATTGDIYYHLCGKIKDQPGMPVVPCPKIPSDKWIKSDSSNRTNAIKQKIFQSTTPNTEPENNRPEEEEITYEDYDFFMISRYFRDLYYQFFITNIQEYMKTKHNAYTMYKYPDLVGGSASCPFGEGACKVDYKLGFKDSNNEKIICNLDLNKIFIYDKNNNFKESKLIADSMINKSIDSFISEIESKGITIEDNNYKIKKDPINAIMGLSYVFDLDETNKHAANTKVQDLIRGKGFSIHKT